MTQPAAAPPRPPTAAYDSRETPGPIISRRHRTKNSLPAAARREVCALLAQRLADGIDLQTQCKQAHWNVKGPQFAALHALFDQVADAAGEYTDLIAERIVQLGGVAEGTARVVAARTTLLDYPLGLATGEQHVAALSDALGQFGRTVRMGVQEMDALQDAVAADILTEVSRGVDKWLWMVESHQHGGAADPDAGDDDDAGDEAGS